MRRLILAALLVAAVGCGHGSGEGPASRRGDDASIRAGLPRNAGVEVLRATTPSRLQMRNRPTTIKRGPAHYIHGQRQCYTTPEPQASSTLWLGWLASGRRGMWR